MKILFLSAEVAPFAKTGGLADVAGALPLALAERGHEVAVVLPKYQLVYNGGFEGEPFAKLGSFSATMQGEKVTARIEVTRFPGTEIPVFFVVQDDYYRRDSLYVDAKTMKAWDNNAARFAFYCRAGLAIGQAQLGAVDILHAHDWHAAPSIVYVRTELAGDPAWAKTRCLFTVHNLAYQGSFPLEDKDALGLPEACFEEAAPRSFTIYNQVNFMKAGLQFADRINTVSRKYSEEIRTPAFGCGLEHILQARAADLTGILNGVDYDDWSPEKDRHLPARYGLGDLAGKAVNKAELQKRHGLPQDPSIPLVGIISRLADQKGFDILERMFDPMMDLGVQFVLLGTGEKPYHVFFEKVAKRYAGRVGINLTFDNPLAHLIEAGSDMFLMPSHYEPCGLNQMYSLKYGTVPVVRSTGGLADTVRDYTADPATGNGFVFDAADADDFLDAVRRAVDVYRQQPEAWAAIIERGMREDHSWNAAASEYEALMQSMREET